MRRWRQCIFIIVNYCSILVAVGFRFVACISLSLVLHEYTRICTIQIQNFKTQDCRNAIVIQTLWQECRSAPWTLLWAVCADDVRLMNSGTWEPEYGPAVEICIYKSDIIGHLIGHLILSIYLHGLTFVLIRFFTFQWVSSVSECFMNFFACVLFASTNVLWRLWPAKTRGNS